MIKRIVLEHSTGLRQILGCLEVRNIADCPRTIETTPVASEFVTDEKRYVLYRAAKAKPKRPKPHLPLCKGDILRDRPSSSNHRAVAEAKLGRKLLPTEVVDHADEDKANNAPANLSAEDRAAHTARHNRARGLSKLRAALRVTQNRGPKSY